MGHAGDGGEQHVQLKPSSALPRNHSGLRKLRFGCKCFVSVEETALRKVLPATLEEQGAALGLGRSRVVGNAGLLP